MSDIHFILTQLGERHAKMLDGYSLSYARLIVGRVRDPSEPEAKQFPIQFIGGNHSMYEEDLTVTADGEWPTGQYIAYCEVDWKNQDLINKFVFRTYCKDPTVLTKCEESECPKFLRQALADCAHKNAKLTSFARQGHPNMFVCADLNSSNAGIGFVYYENNESGLVLKAKTTVNKVVGLSVPDGLDTAEGHVSRVKPNRSYCYPLKTIIRSGSTFGYGCIPQFVAPEAQDVDEPFVIEEEKEVDKDAVKNQ